MVLGLGQGVRRVWRIAAGSVWIKLYVVNPSWNWVLMKYWWWVLVGVGTGVQFGYTLGLSWGVALCPGRGLGRGLK